LKYKYNFIIYEKYIMKKINNLCTFLKRRELGPVYLYQRVKFVVLSRPEIDWNYFEYMRLNADH
tara:strand:- start:96 stop:287 length:192 start_codon:yes stop_codon:yes gene_type:complete